MEGSAPDPQPPCILQVHNSAVMYVYCFCAVQTLYTVVRSCCLHIKFVLLQCALECCAHSVLYTVLVTVLVWPCTIYPSAQVSLLWLPCPGHGVVRLQREVQGRS